MPGKVRRAARAARLSSKRKEFAEPYQRGWVQGMRATAAGRAELARLRYGIGRGARHTTVGLFKSEDLFRWGKYGRKRGAPTQRNPQPRSKRTGRFVKR